jgi:SAM-dependent methyltransferase
MRAFWDDRAAEDPYYFVDHRVEYGNVDEEVFWAGGAEALDSFQRTLGFEVGADDVVVDIGCGIGRMTRALAALAARVIAIDVSAVMIERARELNPGLDNVDWVVGDGSSLTGVRNEAVDGCFSLVTFQHIPDPTVTLAYIREMGRVLRPGCWAAFQLSTAASVPWTPTLSDRLRLAIRGKLGRGPRGQTHPAWVGSTVSGAELQATAEQGGLQIKRLLNPEHLYSAVLAVKSERASGTL